MNDLNTLMRAKMYMDQLAQGIDPISGQEMPDDSILNHVRLARCFFYVSGVLEQIIANGGKVSCSSEKTEFSISPEQIAAISVSTEPIKISEFIDLLFMAANNPMQKKPAATFFTNWLLAKGFLTVMTGEDGKTKRIPSDNGRNIGIISQWKQGMRGEYLAILYTDRAQQFLLDNLYTILNK